jgi:hypothetical protein
MSLALASDALILVNGQWAVSLRLPAAMLDSLCRLLRRDTLRSMKQLRE